MPITPVDKPLFPDVPNVLGVPALRRQLTTRQTTTLIISRILQRIILRRFSRPNIWGIFNEQGVVIAADSVFSLDFRAESKVSEVPLQRGAFAAYNKVQMPQQTIVRLIKRGNDDVRSAFLREIDKAQKSTDLYHVVTPERTYLDANIESYDYRRTAEAGVSMIIVDVKLKEIRQVSPSFATIKLPDAKSPTAPTPRASGFVQPSVIPAAQESYLSRALNSFKNGIFSGY